MFRSIIGFFRDLFSSGRRRQELDEEMEFHIERLTQDLIEEGMDPSEAAREARIRFGSSERVHSRSREVGGTLWVEEGVRNVQFALRSVRRSPLFSITFILTIGLCIGMSTATFSVVDAVLWKPLPYPHADRLATVVTYAEGSAPSTSQASIDGSTWERIEEGADFLERAVYSDWHTGVNLSTAQAAEYVQQQRVSAGFFETLGIPPARGREFELEEDRPGAAPVVILSHHLWQQTFEGDPEVLGSTIRLKGDAHTVVGIMPEDLTMGYPVDLWTPLKPSRTGEGGGTNYAGLVRIPAGMDFQTAQARMRGVPLPAPTDPETPQRYLGLIPLKVTRTSGVQQPLLILMGAMILMLLVAAANLAGLQLARAVARRGEFATRQALGGGSGMILRQILTENAVLGVLGGLAGLGISMLLMGAMETLVQVHLGVTRTVAMDARVLAAGAGFTMLATLLFGLAPALQARGFDVRSILVGSAGRGVLGGSGHRLRKSFLVGEVALVTALLFGAGLLLRSYMYLNSLERGFDPQGVLTVRLSMDDARYATRESLGNLVDDSLRRIRALPGVQSAAVGLTLPYERPLNMPYRVPGVDPPEDRYPITNVVYVSPGYFKTLGIPLLRGRVFGETERPGSEPVAVVNRAFGEIELGGRDPIQHYVNFMGGADVRVVGVVGDTQQRNGGWGSDEPIWKSPVVFVPLAHMESSTLQMVHTWFSPSWVIKASGEAAALAAPVTAAIQEADPGLPIASVDLMTDVMAGTLSRPRFEAAFLTVIAALTLLLAAVGLFGVVANEVVERTPEMGVRMALGATPGRAALAVGVPGLRLTLIGLVLGGVLAVPASRWLEVSVWGVTPFDPVTLACVVGVLLAVSGLASLLPVIRITRLEPARILREE